LELVWRELKELQGCAHRLLGLKRKEIKQLEEEADEKPEVLYSRKFVLKSNY
jgi:hypothetical protein